MATATAAILAVAACGGSSGVASVEPHATVPTAPPTTADPYAVPATIDAAYVNKVLEGLDAAVGDIVRLVIATRQISPEVIDRLNALYINHDDANLLLQGIQDVMRKNFVNIRSNPGNEKSTVTEMITSSRACIFAKLSKDYSAVTSTGDAATKVEWIGLKPSDSTKDPNDVNPTPWMIATEGLVLPGGTAPSNPCSGAS
ncbi:MAG: hypothetical protein V7605_857 [Acidimicrobiaceae bacterium]